ncbi:hypothetical protein POM88_046097 [Heracleum sosnowskyi]|uniref:Mei2-like C-terminal RNA recognition motif domain-containing protein n=1 Tax=Heracleum sosnowskyi TaxID=360622 RepID=A0AAD8M727_9APIA|nr:hypothetical protein POM88_046097 [Heracleum sosnowskyi]
MCRSNTNSRMTVVSTNTSPRPLNPYAAPFIRSTAIYPHLLCASAVIHHPKLKYPTKTKAENNKYTKHYSTACKLAHPIKMREGHNRVRSFRGGRRLFVPPRQRVPAPVTVPEKLVWRTKLVCEEPVPVSVPEKIVVKTDLVSEVAEDMECKETSVMMRNIPNQYRRDDLLDFIDKLCLDNQMQYDFLYLPMDFKRHNNKGYAFINFTKPNHARVFQDLMNGYEWGWVNLRNSSFKSTKICEITWAKIQGKNGLVRHFSNSHFPCHTKKYLPVILSPPSNGSSAPITLTTVGRYLKLH